MKVESDIGHDEGVYCGAEDGPTMKADTLLLL